MKRTPAKEIFPQIFKMMRPLFSPKIACLASRKINPATLAIY